MKKLNEAGRSDGVKGSPLDCVFCKILAGELPCKKVYEDAYTIAFLPLNPDHPEHVLVIPKNHCRNIIDCPPKILSMTMDTVQKLTKQLVEKYGCARVVQNNEAPLQEVFHLHFHIIPCESGNVKQMKGKKMA